MQLFIRSSFMSDLTVIVPYRERPTQLAAFLDYMQPFPDVLIIEQAPGKPFNRGRLLNVGFLNCTTEYVLFHDVDMLPFEVDLTRRPGITQLARSRIQLSDYLGGVTMFDRGTFQLLGGYHNDYFHRAEDNELMFQAKRKKVPIVNRFGTFKMQNHARPILEFDPVLWRKAQEPRKIDDQLSCCEYAIIQRSEGHLLVAI